MMAISSSLFKANLKDKWMETATKKYEFPFPL